MIKKTYIKEYDKLAKKLRLARLGKGLSQVNAANILGVTQSFISKIEAGQVKLDVFQLKEISKVYNKKLDWFFN